MTFPALVRSEFVRGQRLDVRLSQDLTPLYYTLHDMSAADEFDDVLTPEPPEVKTEDSNYDGQQELDQDLDMDKDGPMSPQHDADMEDLFGDDKPADEVVPREGSVI